MKTLSLILILFLASCQSIDASLYAGKDIHPDNKQAIGIAEIQANFEHNMSCKYQHRSDITRGRPFNDWGENYSHDIIVCGFTKQIWSR